MNHEPHEKQKNRDKLAAQSANLAASNQLTYVTGLFCIFPKFHFSISDHRD